MKTPALPFLLSSLLAFGFAGACAEESPPDGDELAEETLEDGEALGKADGLADNFTFFTIRRDYRKCMYPMCGGYFVERVNRHYTRCADGQYQQSCYVVDTDWSASELPVADVDALMSNGNKLLLRARIAPVDIEDFGIYGSLQVSEAWFGGSDQEPAGLFTRVRDSGLRCFTTPCYNTLYESKLNSFRGAYLSEIYLDDTEVGDEEIQGAHAQVYGDDGLIVAGYRYWFWDGSWERGRYVTQFYERYHAPVE
jgi:hypothetical protein